MRSQIIGCGSYLPANVVSNAELAKRIDSSDEWIVTRTGIRQRHIVAKGELTSDLGTRAGERALEKAGIRAAELDAVIVATTTPDDTFPATATRVQAGLGALGSFAFDIQAVCAGFVFGLAVADNFIRSGQARTVLLIGAETYSRILDWEDRGTCVLFGDGAGAVVLQASNGSAAGAGATDGLPGVICTRLHSDGRYRDILFVDGGPSRTQTVGHLRMSGKEVFRHAVNELSAVGQEALEANGLTVDDIDWVIPHQANLRILDGISRKLNVDPSRVVTTVDRHANTSAASIPLAFDEARRDGRIQAGQLVLMLAIGGGLSWGAALVRC